MSYVFAKNRDIERIIYMEFDLDGYQFHPRYNLNQPYIQVSSVKIYKQDMIENLVNNRFASQFNRLAGIILRFIETDDDETSDSDCMLLLDDIERLRRALELNYKKYLENRAYIQYIHDLAILDNELRQKLAYMNQIKQEEYESTHRRSR